MQLTTVISKTLSMLLAIASAKPISFEEHAGKEETIKELFYKGYLYDEIDGAALAKFVKLEKLEITCTTVESIPKQLWELKSLRELNLSSNGIESISEEIKNLENLHTLNLSSNDLEEIPEEISHLPGLRNLGIANVVLYTVPLLLSVPPAEFVVKTAYTTHPAVAVH